jgi:hypothetical protein
LYFLVQTHATLKLRPDNLIGSHRFKRHHTAGHPSANILRVSAVEVLLLLVNAWNTGRRVIAEKQAGIKKPTTNQGVTLYWNNKMEYFH